MKNFPFFIFILIILIYIYKQQYYKIKKEFVFTDDYIKNNKFKTGDLILFKAYNNFNSLVHGSYFGHIGIVYIGDDNIPYIFEANGIETLHNKTGIYKGLLCTKLINRVQRYKGRCFVKPLNKPITKYMNKQFYSFILYCLKNMFYQPSVFNSWIKKIFRLEKCNFSTNCGEIVFLSVIFLKLLPIEYYDKNISHHLLFMCDLTQLDHGYHYNDLIELIDSPFE
jgi:hypothetical protein